jgi:hypothetical protein
LDDLRSSPSDWRPRTPEAEVLLKLLQKQLIDIEELTPALKNKILLDD